MKAKRDTQKMGLAVQSHIRAGAGRMESCTFDEDCNDYDLRCRTSPYDESEKVCVSY